jgi:WD40 repeat protein/predicted Ser/Thr protein kinase
MTDAPGTHSASLPLATLERIDCVCLEFEAAWKRDEQPRIEGYLGATQGLERRELLRELLLLDVDYRRHRGEIPTIAEYQRRFEKDSDLLPHILEQLSTVAQPETTPIRKEQPCSELKLPCRFGDYELLSLLGEGGMGVVYRARQSTPDRIVALKIIRPDRLATAVSGQQQKVIERFRAEAQAVAQLEHDNILPLYDVGEINGRPFFSMRHVEGRGLEEVLRNGPMPDLAAAAILEPVARAVHYAHSRGLVHRDIKPRNILLDGNGRPYVTDFGLAKSLASGQELTQTLEVLGTPAYMSPEQALGQSELGPATDIYSQGATLYELITGRPPFRAASVAETLRQVIHDEPVSPRRLNPAVHRDLETICLKCLQKEPRHRIESAAQLADELQRFQRGEPILSRPISFTARGASWCRRNPQQAGLVLAVTVVLMLGTVVSSAFAVRNRRLADSERELREEAEDAGQQQKRLAEQARRDRDQAVRNAYLADMRLIDRALEAGQHGRVEDLLAAHLPQAGQQDLRGWVWYWQLARSRLQVTRLHDRGPPIRDLQVSPDRSRVAVLQGEVFRCWDTATTEPTIDWAGLADANVFAWSPDASQVAVVNSETLTVYSLADQSIVWQRDHGGGSFSSLDWSRNGNWLAGADGDRSVCIWDARTGEETANIEVPDRLYAVDWRPDGERLAIACRKHLLVWGLSERGFAAEKEFPGWEGPFTVAWSPEGRRIAYGAGHADFPVEIWDVGRDVVQTLRGHVDEVWAVRWSPDGSQLASGGYDRTIRIWDATNGQLIQVLDGHRRQVKHLDWSGDGSRLYSAGDDGLVNVWRMNEPDSLAVLLGQHKEAVERVKWSPDGTRLVSAGWDQSVFAWNVRTGRRVVEIQRPGGHSSGPAAWRFDGRQLAVSQRLAETMKSEIVLYDALLGECQGRLAEVPFLTDEVEWSPDGRFVAVSGESSLVYVFDVSKGTKLHCWQANCSRVQDMAWSPDGQSLALCGQGHVLEIWDASTGQMRVELGMRGAEVREGVCWSPNSKKIASVSSTGVVQIWDCASATLERELWGHRGGVVAVDWSPDGRLLASGGKDGEVRIWSTASGAELLSLASHDRPVRSVAWSPDGQRLASGGWDNVVRIWDASPGYAIAEGLAHSEASPAAWEQEAVDALNARIARSPNDVELRLQHAVMLDNLGRSEEASEAVQQTLQLDPANLQFRPRIALWLASRGDWSTAADILRSTLKDRPDDGLLWMQFATLLARSGETTRFRDAATSMLEYLGETSNPMDADKVVKICLLTPEVIGDLEMLVRRADFAVSGDPSHGCFGWFQLARGMAAYRQRDYKAALDWLRRSRTTEGTQPAAPLSLVTGALLFEAMSHYRLGDRSTATANLQQARELLDRHAGVETDYVRDWHDWLLCHVVFREAEATLTDRLEQVFPTRETSEDGSRLPDGHTTKSAVERFPQERLGAMLRAAELTLVGTLTGHEAAVRSIAVSRDGALLASASFDVTARLWDLHNNREALKLIGHGPVIAASRGSSPGVNSVAFLFDGQRVVTGGMDGKVKTWDVETGRELQSLAGHTKRVLCVAASPTAEIIVSCSDDRTVRIWNPAEATFVKTLTDHQGGVEAVRFSPDGLLLASASWDGVVCLWETTGWSCVRQMTLSTCPRSLAWSPDGATLAVGTDLGTVELWDTVAGSLRRTMSGHQGIVWALVYSWDGTLLATGGQDQTIRLWDLASDRFPLIARGHEGDVYSLAFLSNGQTLASSGADRTVKLWNVAIPGD